jgi:AcrR family transcriptional regulator
MTTAQQRKQQERQARRRRIQRAAREVFAEKGYARTSIEQVAKQAGLSVGAIYLYFRSKEDLYVSLLEETYEVFEAELRQLRTRGDLTPADKVRSAWLFLSQWAVSDVEGTRTLRMLSQPAVKKQLTPEVTEATQRGIGMIRGGLAALIAEAVRTGQYREVDAEPTADMLWALFLGLLESNDVRLNLELQAPGFTESARSALAVFEGSLRLAPARIAEAA